MLNVIRVAIVDDHPLMREGLGQALEGIEGFAVVGFGDSAEQALHLVKDTQPDILILDLNIKGTGLQVLRDLRLGTDSTRVLVLTISEDELDLLESLRRGASGYAVKGIEASDLRSVLRRIHEGETYVAPSLGARILTSISQTSRIPSAKTFSCLSKREAEIHLLIRKGHCNKEIGRSLNLSEKTVKHYLTNIFRKLNVQNRTELAMAN
jgi:two-component system nitrate/nitrite response regulator NarL